MNHELYCRLKLTVEEYVRVDFTFKFSGFITGSSSLKSIMWLYWLEHMFQHKVWLWINHYVLSWALKAKLLVFDNVCCCYRCHLKWTLKHIEYTLLSEDKMSDICMCKLSYIYIYISAVTRNGGWSLWK